MGHLARGERKDTQTVGRIVRRLHQVAPGRAGQIEHRPDRRLDFARLKAHPPERDHCIGRLLGGVGGRSAQFLRHLRQARQVAGGCLGDRLNQAHRVIEVGKGSRCQQ